MGRMKIKRIEVEPKLSLFQQIYFNYLFVCLATKIMQVLITLI